LASPGTAFSRRVGARLVHRIVLTGIACARGRQALSRQHFAAFLMTCARLLPAVAEVHLVATAADNLTPVELLNNDYRS
jgi:hypothetical protein